MLIRVCSALCVLSLAGCAVSAPPSVLPTANPIDSESMTGRARYTPVITNYEHRQAVSPKPWRRTEPAVSKEGTGS